MHVYTFTLAFSIFVALGVVLPLVLSNISEKGRTHG